MKSLISCVLSKASKLKKCRFFICCALEVFVYCFQICIMLLHYLVDQSSKRQRLRRIILISEPIRKVRWPNFLLNCPFKPNISTFSAVTSPLSTIDTSQSLPVRMKSVSGISCVYYHLFVIIVICWLSPR